MDRSPRGPSPRAGAAGPTAPRGWDAVAPVGQPARRGLRWSGTEGGGVVLVEEWGSRRVPGGQEPSGGAVFTAGQVVRPGTYRRVDVPDGRVVDLRDRGALPASLDGTVALYRRVTPIDVRAASGGGRPTRRPGAGGSAARRPID